MDAHTSVFPLHPSLYLSIPAYCPLSLSFPLLPSLSQSETHSLFISASMPLCPPPHNHHTQRKTCTKSERDSIARSATHQSIVVAFPEAHHRVGRKRGLNMVLPGATWNCLVTPRECRSSCNQGCSTAHLTFQRPGRIYPLLWQPTQPRLSVGKGAAEKNVKLGLEKSLLQPQLSQVGGQGVD